MRLAINGWFYDRPHNRCWLIELIPPAILIAAAWALFYPSLHYGFIWDDPIWLKVSVQDPPWQMLTAAQTWEDYRYYRPIGLGMIRFFARADGTFDAGAMHVTQVGVHSIASALVYVFARQLRLKPLTALVAGGLFSLFPHNHQAVVRVLQGEPLCTVFVLISAILYLRARSSPARAALMLSTASYMAALFTLESAVPFAALFPALEFWLWRRGEVRRFGWSWLPQAALAVAFMIAWRALPPQHISGARHIGFYPQTLSVLLQAAAYPLGLAISALKISLPEIILASLFALTTVAVAVLLWRAGRWVEMAVCAVWFALGTCLVMLLDAEYVRLGPRLIYLGSVAAALGWASLAEAAAERMGASRLAASLLAVSLLWICWQVNRTLTRMYTVGNAHLRAVIETLPASGEEFAFVNYPDRFALKEPPLPIGYWGITVAEGALNLADYAEVSVGPRPPAASLAVPAIGAGGREAWPYQVDMRGNVLEAGELYAALRDLGRVYYSEYTTSGGLTLIPAGGIYADAVTGAVIATLDDKLSLASARVERIDSNHFNLILHWQVSARLDLNDTIFVHLLDANSQVVAGADGDSLGGLVPLSVWQPGDTIVDERLISLPMDLLPGNHVVTVGVYNRASGERLPALNSKGEPVWENEIQVGSISVP